MPRPRRPEAALDRFLRYVKVDTQSSEDAASFPSSPGQRVLARLLRDELRAMGATGARVDAHGYVYATIPATLPSGHPAHGRVPRVGLVAHLDTAPAASGAGVRPIVRTYRGGDVRLRDGVVLRARENPELQREVGKRIVTSDGTTLLGADDKAGVAVIMTLAEELLRGAGGPHGEVRLCFTPDEEVGNGTRHLDLRAFGAEVAYTIDGGPAGVLNRETFSADAAVITVHGVSIHPAEAKGRMVNAVRVLAEVIARLPAELAPETTEGRQPYVNPYAAEASVGKATLRLALRDFETAGLQRQRRLLERILREVGRLYPRARLELEVKESYRNMRDGLARDPRVSTALEEATRRAGVAPRWEAIRGGTDGSKLTALGLPTPNLFTGGHNYHGPTEWLSVEGLEASLEAARQLLGVWVELATPPASRGRRAPRRPGPARGRTR